MGSKKKQEHQEMLFKYRDMVFEDVLQDEGGGCRDQSQVCYDCMKTRHLRDYQDIHLSDVWYGETCGIAGCQNKAEIHVKFEPGALGMVLLTEQEYRQLVEQTPECRQEQARADVRVEEGQSSSYLDLYKEHPAEQTHDKRQAVPDDELVVQKREWEQKITGLWTYAAELRRINRELGTLNYRETTRRGLNRDEQERRIALIKEQRSTTAALQRDYGVRSFAGIEKAVAACQSMLTRLELQQQQPTHHVPERRVPSYEDLFKQPAEQERKPEQQHGHER